MLLKKRLEDLAIFGGSPLFSEKLHVGRPNIGDREALLRRFNDMLDRRWLSNDGPFVRDLEDRLAKFLGVKHCVAVCNGTIGIELTAKALGLSGEVILPAFAFIAAPHALEWQGIRPVFCDVDPRTHNIDPEQVEQLITPLTTAILGVHVWGRACNVERLADIAARHGLRLIFDAAHAFACTYHGMQIGGFGDAEVFSFHATKYLNTFEGGAITTNDDVLATKLRRMRNFGFAGSEGVIDLGTNAKMSEVAGLMGVTSLESLDDFIETNRHNHAAYSEGLQDVPGIELMNYDERESNNHQYVVADIDAHISGIDRDILHRTLRAENILTQRYFCPACHQMEPYQSRFPTAGETLPETEALSRRLMQLPTGTAVAPAQIRAVCEMIRFSAAHGAAITDRIGKEGSLLP